MNMFVNNLMVIFIEYYKNQAYVSFEIIIKINISKLKSFYD